MSDQSPLPAKVPIEVPAQDISKLTSLEAIALSEASYLRRLRAHIAIQQKQYLKNDLIYSIVAALIVGGVALIAGEVTADSVFWGVLTFLVVFVVMAIKHAVNAPREIDGVVRARLIQAEHLLEPKLIISFEPHPVPNKTPFYEEFKGDDGEWWELYRIAVTGSIHTVAWLKVREVTLSGYQRFNVYLHRMHAETRIVRVEMAPDQPEYWDVVQKNRKMDHALLTHIQPNLGYDLPSGEQRFEVVASARHGAAVTKLVVVTIDVEKKLHVRIEDG